MDNNIDNHFDAFNSSFTKNNQKKDLLSAFLNQFNNFATIDDKGKLEEFAIRPENNAFNRIFDEQNNDNDKDFPFYSLYDQLPDNELERLEDNNFLSTLYQKKPSINNTKKIPLNDFLGKKKKAIFTAANATVSDKKELKLLLNRLSAKKCRTKKKEYIQELEKELSEAQKKIEAYESKMTLSDNVTSSIDQMKTYQEKAVKEKLSTTQYDHIKKEYQVHQSQLLTQLINQLCQSIMPFDCMIFQLKHLNLEQILPNDTIDIISDKINKNINSLNELFSFNSSKEQKYTKKDSVQKKLYMMYVNLKQFIEFYNSN